MVDINNYRKTFLVVYCYITSKSIASFKFVTNQLSNLAFYNYPKATIIVGDFSKGLRATYTAKAAIDLSLTKIIEEPLFCLLNRDEEMLEAIKVVVYKVLGKP